MNTKFLRLGLFLAIASFVLPQMMSAATVTVCDEASLRAAITNGGTINFGCDGTILLSSTLQITTNTVLDGTGHNVVINGGDAFRVFAVVTNVDFTMKSLVITHGKQQGAKGGWGDGQPAFGAGLFNDGGRVSLIDCTFSNNVAIGGDGVLNPGEPPPVPEPDHQKGGHALGGAIYNNGGFLALSNSFLSGNSCLGGIGGGLGVAAADNAGGDAAGGALYSQGGIVTIDSTEVRNNSVTGGQPSSLDFVSSMGGSAMGGALWVAKGAIAISQTHFSNNQARGGSPENFSLFNQQATGSAQGGAAYFDNSNAKISVCKFLTNSSVSGDGFRYAPIGFAKGGAIFNAGELETVDTLFTGNGSFAGFSQAGGAESQGGAICSTARFSINRSIVAGNEVRGGGAGSIMGTQYQGGPGKGGGIYNSGDLFGTNNTIAFNQASGGPDNGPGDGIPGTGEGGGIFNQAGLTLVHVTMASNDAQIGGHRSVFLDGSVVVIPSTVPGLGGGVFTTNGSSTLQNTIIANSLSASNSFGGLIDDGNNISSDASCEFTAPGSLNNTDPLLSPLDDFGGPTPTMALLAGSPAIDHGLAIYCPATDQRGIARPFGSGCDIGAFESAPPYSVRGFVFGSAAAETVSLSNAMATNTITAPSQYILSGMLTGTFTIMASASNGVVIPNSRTVTVGPDLIHADFKVYQLNALTVESYTNQVLHLIFAGTNGQSYQVQTATNLTNWASLGTNVVGTNGIFDFFYTNDLAESSRFFQTQRP